MDAELLHGVHTSVNTARRSACATALAYMLLVTGAAVAQDLPRGQIVDGVKCASDAAQTYALYLPSNYSADHEFFEISHLHKMN